MFIFTVDMFAQTASFRIPENHTFQPTLPLPPITTLTGLMGAALGLPFDEALAFKKEHDVSFGIIGTHQGDMRDLWKYWKVKHNETIKDVLIREYVTDFEATIAVGAPAEATSATIREAVCHPTYALTLGTSDDLVKIRHVSDIAHVEPSMHTDFENTALSGDSISRYDVALDIRNTSVTTPIRAPQAFLLPTDFTFEKGGRRVSQRKLFTFVGSPITLKEPIRTYSVNGRTFEMLS